MNTMKENMENMMGEMGKEDKKKMMCSMMEKCCADMTADDKKNMMGEMMSMMGGEGGAGMMGMMMKKCMKGFRWFPLIPMSLGFIFFLIGYFLDAETVRIVWLLFSGLILIVGLFGFIMMRAMSRE